MGLLSPQDIKESGLVFDNHIEEVWDDKEGKMIKKSIGYMAIPTQDYYISDSRLGPLGSKYVGPSKQFLDWYMKHRKPEHIDENERYIDRQEKKTERSIPVNGAWDLEDVVF